jgi:serine/threonine-protein kinase
MKATGSGAAADEVSGFIPAYTRLFELGRGGMARVYLAESHASGLRKLVVLKELNPELSADPEFRAAFRREAELSAQMNHPNVVQVMAVNEYSGVPSIVMEHLDGLPLSTLLGEAGQHLSLPLRIYILMQVLAGLHYFHELRDLDGAPLHAVHRDVSPQNVMILHDGPVKVLDFGIAKVSAGGHQATRTGTVKGKLHYMPPEQLLDGTHVDRRADVFAVGVMLWEAIADRRMWQGKTEVELLRCLATGALPNLRDAAPSVPESLVQVVARAISVDKEQRYATALEMLTALECVLAEARWVVQQRELAEFMQHHFGQKRHEDDLKIKSALRALREPNLKSGFTPQACVVPITKARESLKPTVRFSSLAAASAPKRSTRHRSWALLIGAFVTLAAALTVRHQLVSVQPSATQPRPSTVTLEVEAHPVGAEISLNGKSLARGHFVGEFPRTDARALIEVSAPGHLKQTREIALRKDLALQIVLEADRVTSASTTPTASANPPALSAPTSRKAVVTANQVRATAKAAHTGSATRPEVSRNCKPPYTLGPDGVKTYKPECF